MSLWCSTFHYITLLFSIQEVCLFQQVCLLYHFPSKQKVHFDDERETVTNFTAPINKLEFQGKITAYSHVQVQLLGQEHNFHILAPVLYHSGFQMKEVIPAESIQQIGWWHTCTLLINSVVLWVCLHCPIQCLSRKKIPTTWRHVMSRYSLSPLFSSYKGKKKDCLVFWFWARESPVTLCSLKKI